MYKVVEMPTAKILGTFQTSQDANNYISNIESSPSYGELLSKYGTLRRVQQELIVEPV